jgi:c-di-AMP phosphodiesterase-like protein
MDIAGDKIKEFIMKSSKVIIMAHKNLDLDALGSSLGIYYLSKSLGREAYLLVEDTIHELGVSKSLKLLTSNKIDINIYNLDKIKPLIDKDTLLIVLDVNLMPITQNDKVLDLINSKIVIDHHVTDKETIKDTLYKYIDEKKSSTSEIVVDLLKQLDIYIPPYIATIMLSGIVIDTNSFLQKTNYKTFEAASYLDEQGADELELKYLLKEDIKRYNRRQEIISGSVIYNDKVAIGMGKKGNLYHPEDLAKVSETLLRFNEIEIAFTIGFIEKNKVDISARSMGNINVQEIMEQLGGGGNETYAATQLKNITLEEVKDKLLKIIYNIKL